MLFLHFTFLWSTATLALAQAAENLKHRQSSLPPDCDVGIVAHSGDTCDSLAAAIGIPSNIFIYYNQDSQHPINNDCTNLVPDTEYCAHKTHGRPTQAGIASNCNQFYQVQSGNTCIQIVDNTGSLTLNDLYVLPPLICSIFVLRR